jgi:hypothetical protein
MSDDYFSALADNAAKTVRETQKVSNKIVSKSSGILPKIFTFAFIALLLYMGFNFARITPSTKKNEIAVGGIFYGNVEADKNGNVNIPLGDKNNLSKGKIDVSDSAPVGNDPEPSPEPNPIHVEPEPKPDVTIKITDRLKVGMSYFDVLALLGAPTKKLQLVNDSKLASGFTVFVWDVDKRLMVTFYKNKLHSVSYQ